MTELRDRMVEITAQGQPFKSDSLRKYANGWIFTAAQPTVSSGSGCQCLSSYQQARTTLEKRRQSERQRLQQLDLLTYQVQELRAANLNDPDEFEQLELERQRLGHVVELQQLSYQVTRRFTKTIATSSGFIGTS